MKPVAFGYTPFMRPLEPHKAAEEIQVFWLLEEVRSRRMGYGKAADLARIPLANFLQLMGKYQLTPFDYDADELAHELS